MLFEEVTASLNPEKEEYNRQNTDTLTWDTKSSAEAFSPQPAPFFPMFSSNSRGFLHMVWLQWATPRNHRHSLDLGLYINRSLTLLWRSLTHTQVNSYGFYNGRIWSYFYTQNAEMESNGKKWQQVCRQVSVGCLGPGVLVHRELVQKDPYQAMQHLAQHRCK